MSAVCLSCSVGRIKRNVRGLDLCGVRFTCNNTSRIAHARAHPQSIVVVPATIIILIVIRITRCLATLFAASLAGLGHNELLVLHFKERFVIDAPFG